MNRMQAYNDVSLELLYLLQNLPPIKEDDDYVQPLNELLQKREVLLEVIKPPYSEEEKVIGKSLVQLDIKIQQLLQNRKVRISEEMMKIKQSKKVNKAYANSFQAPSLDGTYYDKRN